MLSNIDLNSTIVSKDRKVSRAKTSKLANLLNPTHKNIKNAMPSRTALRVLLIEAKELKNQQQEKQQVQSRLKRLKEAAVDAIMEKNKTIEILQHTLKNTEIELNMRSGIDTTQIEFHLSAIEHLHMTIRNLQKSHQEELQIKNQAIQQMEEQKDQIKFKIYQLQALGLMKEQRLTQLQEMNRTNKKALSQLSDDAQKINIRLSEISRILDSGSQKMSNICSQVKYNYSQKSGIRVRDIYQERAKQHREKIQQLKQYYEDYIKDKVSLTKSITVQQPQVTKIRINRISIADEVLFDSKSDESIDYEKCAMSLRHQISSIGIQPEIYSNENIVELKENNPKIQKKNSIFAMQTVEKVQEVEKDQQSEKFDDSNVEQIQAQSIVKSVSASSSKTLTTGIAVVAVGTFIFLIKKLRDL